MHKLFKNFFSSQALLYSKAFAQNVLLGKPVTTGNPGTA